MLCTAFHGGSVNHSLPVPCKGGLLTIYCGWQEVRSGWGAFWIVFPTRAGTFSNNSFKSSQTNMLNLGDGAGSGAGASRENVQSTHGC